MVTPRPGLYETEITRELAEIGVRAAQAKAREAEVDMSIAVADKAGRPVMFVRGDGRGPFAYEMTMGRTVAAVIARRRTVDMGGFYSTGNVFPAPFMPVPGGAPVMHEGKVLGAVGCGGGTSEQDQECADAAAEAIVAAFARG